MTSGTYPVVLKYEKLSENDIRNFYEHENITTMLNVMPSTGVADLSAHTGNSEIYNLAGQRVNKPMKGIYIRNNKKILVK